MVVSVNQFNTDTETELKMIVDKARNYGASGAVVATHWAEGGKGARSLAEKIIEVCEKSQNNFRLDY